MVEEEGNDRREYGIDSSYILFSIIDWKALMTVCVNKLSYIYILEQNISK